MIRLTRDIPAALAIRRAVFIEEQNVPEAEEVDGLDDAALHLLAFRGDRPVGTARLLFRAAEGKIGRVAVLKEARGLGLGRALTLAAVEELRRQGAARATLGAQTHAIGFYAALGFTATGPEFLDAGIPHRKMVLDL